MKKFSKILAVTLATVMLVSAFGISVSAMDVRQWKDKQYDSSLLDITDKINWESGTFTTTDENVQVAAAASDQIRVAKNFDAGQLYIECKPGYQLMFAECVDNEGTLTYKRKYSWEHFRIPAQQWISSTYLNTYADRVYTIIIKSTSGAALNPAKASDYVTVSEVDVRYHVPEYYVDHLVEKAQYINDLQDDVNSFSFIYISDIHLQHNTKHSAAMIRYLRNQCSIDEVLCGGDSVTAWLSDADGIYGLWDDMEELKYIYDGVPMIKNLGNHEWAYGTYNQWNITNQQAYNRFFRDYDAYDKTVVYNDTKQYFYKDDPVNKMRYISVNAMDYPSHKIVTDFDTNNFVQNKAMWYEVSDAQIDWLETEALQLPDHDWKCMVLLHVPVMNSSEITWRTNPDSSNAWGTNGVAGDSATAGIRNCLSDFVNKTGAFAGAKGTFVGMFNGHEHEDVVTKLDGFNVFITDCDSVTSSGDFARDINTVSEQSFNVVTVNAAEGKVYITKIGAGENLEFTF